MAADAKYRARDRRSDRGAPVGPGVRVGAPGTSFGRVRLYQWPPTSVLTSTISLVVQLVADAAALKARTAAFSAFRRRSGRPRAACTTPAPALARPKRREVESTGVRLHTASILAIRPEKSEEKAMALRFCGSLVAYWRLCVREV